MVYASPNARKRQALWSALRNLAHSIFCPWFIVGDFNATLFDSDRQGCAVSAKPSKAFQDFVFDHGLRDMGFSGPDFTWSRGMAHVRLDRVLCNSYWDETFPESIVNHLFRMKSDHRPILFAVGNSDQLPRSKQFRYFSGWLSHDDFPRMVQDNWQSSDDIVVSIKHFTKAASLALIHGQRSKVSHRLCMLALMSFLRSKRFVRHYLTWPLLNHLGGTVYMPNFFRSSGLLLVPRFAIISEVFLVDLLLTLN
ncbi:hypothetical protein V6N13_023495 [Hibiscus sabdariffa]